MNSLGKPSGNVRNHGAVGDGVADDAPAIQRALDCGAGTITVPPGVYRLGTPPLRIGSGTRLILAGAATIRLGDGVGTHPGIFMITNKDWENGDRDIVVSGGIWDGNAGNNTRGERYDLSGYTGTGINFINVDGLTLRHFTLHNYTAFGVRMCKIKHFLIEDITFDNDIILPNQDGIHINGFTEEGVIRRIRAATPMTPNDDMVALNADDGLDCVFNIGMVCGPIRRVHVEDLEAAETWSFVRMLSTENAIEDITIENLCGGARYHVLNMDTWRFPAGTGDIRGVRIKDVDVSKVGDNDQPLICIGSKVTDFTFENYTRRDHKGTPTSCQTLHIANAHDNKVTVDGVARTQPRDESCVIASGGFGRLEIDTMT